MQKKKCSQCFSQSVMLGDPSARVFEVFLIVLDGVQGETLWGGNPARATTLMSESERQGNRQSSGQLSSSDA